MAADADEEVPAGQEYAEVNPVSLANVPGGELEQAFCVPLDEEFVPRAQGVQSPAPAAENDPGGQRPEQIDFKFVLPVILEKVPASQLTHADWASRGFVLPRAQSMQSERDVRAVRELNVPFGQG